MMRFVPSRIIEELSAAIEQAKDAGATQEVIASMVSTREMLERKDEFTGFATSEASATCDKIQTNTFQYDWKAEHEQGKTHRLFKPDMLCGSVEGQFLKSLVSMHKAKRVLEVGMFTGYSALSMAEALPADGEIVTLEICDFLEPLVRDWTKDSPHASKIRIEIGPGQETLAKLAQQGEQFDLIFIDCRKDLYISIVEMAFDGNLLSAGGTVLVDNAFVHGGAYIPSDNNTLAHDLAKFVKSREDLHSVMVPLNDGVLMIRRIKDVEGKTAK